MSLRPTSSVDPELPPEGWAFRFFTPHEARTVEAVMARIMPDDDLGPGAVEAGTVYYADITLSGVELERQTVYRSGVNSLDAVCRSRYGRLFADCSPVEQDAIIGDMADGSLSASVADGDAGWDQPFFEVLREHTLEGMFSDPVHGGNRGLSGWRLLGYPGPQPAYSHEEQQVDAPIVRDRTFTAADYPLPQAEES